MRSLEKTLRYIVLGGIFALPFICLIVADGVRFPYNFFFPFITGKNFTFRIIVEIVSGAWLSLALIYPAYRPRRSWILGAFALFVLVMAIADAQGVNPFKSFWSNYERMDGWVTLIHLLALLIVASSTLTSEKLWRRFWETSLGVSVFVALYGLLQVAGQLATGEGGTGGLSARIDATFGNPIYLAVYMLFHIFLAALLWARARSSGARGWLSAWYGSVIVLDSFALLFTGTRGTILGLIGGALLALVFYAFTSSASQRLKRYALGSVGVLVVAGALLVVARDTALVQQVVFLNRLSSISLNDATTKARLLNMHIALQGAKERPVFGWGQENYAIVFDKYYDPQMYGQEPWFDRVHDIVFDWLIAGGIFGLLSYLSIFAVTVWALLRKGSGFSDIEKSILAGLLAGYFFHNLFVFDNITSYILFAFVLAYIAWRSAEASRAPVLPQREFLPRAALAFVAIACTALVWGVAWFVNANAIAANLSIIAALSPQPSGILQNLALYKQSISYGTYGMQEAREQLAQATTQVAGMQQVDLATKQQFFDTATSEMTLQAEASPLDARFPLFLGIIQGAYGDYTDARTSLEKAHELSPDKQAILFQIGLNEQAAGNSAAALAAFKQAYELAPQFHDPLFLYAAEAIQTGNETLADQLLTPLIPTGEAADTRIAAAYAQRGEYGKIATIWAAHVKAQPQDAQGYFTLAAAYVGAGDSQDAIATLKAVEAVSPSTTAQAESLIQQVRNGTAKVQ
jgi:tetratricopeptide (TPR) repeat protein/O-antigen ligase